MKGRFTFFLGMIALFEVAAICYQQAKIRSLSQIQKIAESAAALQLVADRLDAPNPSPSLKFGPRMENSGVTFIQDPKVLYDASRQSI